MLCATVVQTGEGWGFISAFFWFICNRSQKRCRLIAFEKRKSNFVCETNSPLQAHQTYLCVLWSIFVLCGIRVMLSPEVERRNPLFRFTFKICILNLFRILYFEFLQNNKKKSKKFGRYRNDMFQVGKILRFFGEQNSRFELRAKISILIEKIFKSPIYRRVTFKLSIRRHLKQSSRKKHDETQSDDGTRRRYKRRDRNGVAWEKTEWNLEAFHIRIYFVLFYWRKVCVLN